MTTKSSATKSSASSTTPPAPKVPAARKPSVSTARASSAKAASTKAAPPATPASARRSWGWLRYVLGALLVLFMIGAFVAGLGYVREFGDRLVALEHRSAVASEPAKASEPATVAPATPVLPTAVPPTPTPAVAVPGAVPTPSDPEEWFATIKVVKNADGSCAGTPSYSWWSQDRAWNSGDKDPTLEFEVPAGQVAIVWGTTLTVDGVDASGAKVTSLGPGKHVLSGWSWGTTLRGTDTWGLYHRYQALLNECAFGGEWTWQSK